MPEEYEKPRGGSKPVGILDRRRVLSADKFKPPKPFEEKIRSIRITLNIVLVLALAMLVALFLAPIEETYTAPGVVRPGDYQRIYAPADLRQSAEPLVQEGQSVERGQLLMEFELPDRQREILEAEETLTELQAQLELQRARIQTLEAVPETKELWELQEQVEQSRKRMDYFRVQLDRVLELEKNGIASDQEVDKARLDFEQAEIEHQRLSQRLEKDYSQPDIQLAVLEARNLEKRVEGARRRLDFLNEEYERLRRVHAPAAGIILDLPEKHTIGLIPRSTELVYMAAGEQKVVVIYGHQRNVDLVRVGQPVRLRSEIFDYLKYGHAEGTVVKKSITRQTAGQQEPGSTPGAFYSIVARIESLPQDEEGHPKELALDSNVSAQIVLRRTPLFKVLFGR